MILEVAILNVQPGPADEFEAAFAEAKRIISAMPGYIEHELQRTKLLLTRPLELQLTMRVCR